MSPASNRERRRIGPRQDLDVVQVEEILVAAVVDRMPAIREQERFEAVGVEQLEQGYFAQHLAVG